MFLDGHPDGRTGRSPGSPVLSLFRGEESVASYPSATASPASTDPRSLRDASRHRDDLCPRIAVLKRPVLHALP
jgi:hypothetical protein